MMSCSGIAMMCFSGVRERFFSFANTQGKRMQWAEVLFHGMNV